MQPSHEVRTRHSRVAAWVPRLEAGLSFEAFGAVNCSQGVVPGESDSANHAMPQAKRGGAGAEEGFLLARRSSSVRDPVHPVAAEAMPGS